MNLKIGTRGSKLALTQTNFVAEKIKKIMPEADIEICVIKTSGDIMQDVSLLTIGGQGVFVKELEEALLSGKIDLAVHSMKDVPGETPEDLMFAAILPREDVRDVLVARDNIKMEFMPKEAKIGTGSQRRGAQIKAMLPDVNIVPSYRSNTRGGGHEAHGIGRENHAISAGGNDASGSRSGRAGFADSQE
jgi:hydroxymethylbilane synthase